MPKAYFSGDALIVHVSAGVTEIDTQEDLYSPWKEWKALSDNTKFPPVFTTIGGNVIGVGREAGDYYFINTSAGWTIETWDGDHELAITGNLYPEIPGNRVTKTIPGRTVAYFFERSQLTQSIETGTLATEQGKQLRHIFKINALASGTPVSTSVSSIHAGASIIVEVSGDPATKVVSKRI